MGIEEKQDFTYEDALKRNLTNKKFLEMSEQTNTKEYEAILRNIEALEFIIRCQNGEE